MRDDESDPGPERQSNPVSRRTLMNRFTDGKWWTASGMAEALGSELSNDLAVRFYRYKQPGVKEGDDLGAFIRSARRRCVTEVLSGVPESAADKRRDSGEVMYRFKSTRKQKVRPVDRPTIQTEPADTEIGITVGGFLAAVLARGGKASVDELVVDLLPAMSPDDRLIAWYVGEMSGKDGKSARRSNHASLPRDELLAKARRAAVMTASQRARSYHRLKSTHVIVFEYSRADPGNGVGVVDPSG